MGRHKRNYQRRSRTEKMKRYVPIVFSVFLLADCASVKTAPAVSESSRGYRNLQGELYRQQADIAAAGQKIEDQGRALADDLALLEEAVAAAPNAGEAGRLVQAARMKAEEHTADIENLNRKLAAERETAGKHEQKFNEYEAVMAGRISIKDAENSRLREEVKTVKGQRNTLLAIVITAVSSALLFAAFKILRFFKALPF
jgi:PBP1b-binding outer membrane lipoprotein LpoB